MTATAWMSDAACAGVDPAIFYPDEGRGYRPGLYSAARAICASCPVRTECADHAIAHRERLGMWGAMTPSELRAAQRKRTRARVAVHGVSRYTRARVPLRRVPPSALHLPGRTPGAFQVTT